MITFNIGKYVIIEGGKSVMAYFPAIVDADMYDTVKYNGWCLNWQGYAATSYPYDQIQAGSKRALHLHRVVTGAPDHLVVHHINGNVLDNRRCNLQVMTRGERTKLHWAEDRERMMRRRWSKTRTEASDAQRKAAAKMPRKGRKESA